MAKNNKDLAVPGIISGTFNIEVIPQYEAARKGRGTQSEYGELYAAVSALPKTLKKGRVRPALCVKGFTKKKARTIMMCLRNHFPTNKVRENGFHLSLKVSGSGNQHSIYISKIWEDEQHGNDNSPSTTA